ncbi:MAG: LLM class F420-dependent oxidoreductase [Alphaproteobacteria bacterium]|nr:LLM class F420-dependent oxidoreductase [Alphaproteobacteria bacterium]
MKLGLLPGKFSGHYGIDMELVREAEDLGFDSAWTSEAWGNDAITPATWILAQTTKLKVGTAIIQMSARTPSMAAMTAMTLHDLSGGRFILGIGPSGPQVIEGWHGQPFGRPIARTREYIEIIRKILAREAPLTHDGRHYQIPFNGEGSTGLGKPLKSIMHGDPMLKIYTAGITPAGLRVSGEVADGGFPIYMDPTQFDILGGPLNEGFAKAGNGKSLADYSVSPFVGVEIGDDIEACRAPVKREMALYIGGMGARDKNFYNDYAKKLGYEGAAVEIQDHFLAGRRAEAEAAVPNELVDAVALVGPKERVLERMSIWKDAAAKGHVDTMVVRRPTRAALQTLAKAVL